jgi:hypothetical protein
MTINGLVDPSVKELSKTNCIKSSKTSAFEENGLKHFPPLSLPALARVLFMLNKFFEMLGNCLCH